MKIGNYPADNELYGLILCDVVGNRPAAGTADRFFWATDEHILYRDTGAAWVKAAVADYPDLDSIPASFTPAAHKATHEPAGADEVNDIDIGNTGVLLSAHKARHEPGGADAMPVDAVAGTGSLRTLGAGAQQAMPGNATPTPAVHGAAQHTDVTRELFLPANEGYIKTGAPKSMGFFACVDGLADGADDPEIYFAMKVPDDFVSFASLQAVWASPAAAGNAKWKFNAHYGASGENYAIHSDLPAYGVTATGGANIINVQEPANPLTLASLAAGDYLGFYLKRDGAHADDTLDDVFKLLGILFTYVANQ